jgi:hypothetical protein
VPNSNNLRQTYNIEVAKYMQPALAVKNQWNLNKITILPPIVSAPGIVPKKLKQK